MLIFFKCSQCLAEYQASSQSVGVTWSPSSSLSLLSISRINLSLSLPQWSLLRHMYTSCFYFPASTLLTKPMICFIRKIQFKMVALGKRYSLAYLMFCGCCHQVCKWQHSWNLKYSLSTYLFCMVWDKHLNSKMALFWLHGCVSVDGKGVRMKDDLGLHPGSASLVLCPWPVASSLNEP